MSLLLGVGKSALIRAISLHAEKILRKAGDHPHRPRVCICAPTGKAAQNVNGVTLHCAFCFKFGIDDLPLSDKSLAMFRQNLSELKLIIIDEMSMMGSDMLYRIHLRLKQIFQTDELFGGKTIILVGDLLQLPPVKGSYIFLEPRNPHFQAFRKVFDLWKFFEPRILQHNHRQAQGGGDWVNSLNRFRVGQVTDSDEKILKGLMTSEEHLSEDCMHIFYTNEEVKKLNEDMLNKLNGPVISVKAIKQSPKGYTPKIKKKTGCVDGTQYMDNLEVKKGARVMLVFNINIIDDLVNGVTGTIVGIEFKSGGIVDCIVVRFDDESVGQDQRAKYPHTSQKYKEVNGTPIFRHNLEYQVPAQRGYGHACKARCIQFPLKLCYACTCHKMQVILKIFKNLRAIPMIFSFRVKL